MRAYLLLFVLIGVGFVSGCSKSEPETRTGNPGPTTGAAPVVTNRPETFARIHFTGTKQLLADTNSARLKEIFDSPGSKALSEDILQKLAAAPYRLFEKKLASGSKPEADLIRPMVEDMLHAESYIEMRGVTNAIPETLIAIRLENDRADYWRTNIASILMSWTALSTSDIEVDGFKGWELKKHKDPNTIRFLRAGDWVVFGWGQDQLLLLPELLSRIKNDQRPVIAAKDYFLHAWVDGPALSSLQPTNLPFGFPSTDITVSSAKDYLRTKVEMRFTDPLNFTLEPWRVPTNIIHDPLVSFTAVRGIGPWVKQIPQIKALNLDSVPNQYFLWAMEKIPFETYIASPVQNGTNYTEQVAARLRDTYNPELRKKGFGQLEWNTNQNQLSWAGIPMISPNLKLSSGPDGEFIKIGFFPSPIRKTPPPTELLAQLNGHANLVYYDWEITQERLPQVRSLTDFVHIISGEALVPASSPVQTWLDEVAPKLGNCGTIGTLSSSNELRFVRNAPIGFSALELNLLKRWVASPNFPLDAKMERVRPGLRSKSTNAPVQVPPVGVPPGTNSTN